MESPSTRAPAPHESYQAGVLVALVQLEWFVRLRWLFTAVALGALAVERFSFPTARRPWQLLVVVLGVAAVNVVWTAASRLLHRASNPADRAANHNFRPGNDPAITGRALFDADHPNPAHPSAHLAHRSASIFANAQVAFDLLLLTAILHFTGGVENPMSVFYLFHVVIGGLLLKAWQAILQAGWAALLFAAIAIAEWRGWLIHYAVLPQLGPSGLYNEPGHMALVVGAVVAAIFGTVYFMWRISALLDSQQAQLWSTNAALQRSQQAIQDLQHRRARFMQTAAHQLKSPLAIVQTLANLMRDGIVTDQAGIQSTCEKIVRRSQEGLAQVTELLTLARVQEADPARHRGSQVDVCQTVTDLCQHYRPLAERKQIELSCWTPQDVELKIGVDPQDFRDCIGNLIDNAIKYTPGPGRVRVAVTSRMSEGKPVSVGIHVSDTGMGFDPGLLGSEGKQLGTEPVFDAFQRGRNAIVAGIPGTGLGLSIVREVVEQAGGRIWVMSRPGAGSSFTVTFPTSAAAGQPLTRSGVKDQPGGSYDGPSRA